ncbi:MAG: hypothetical protein NTW07_08620 [candidate division Zixibacteria bacterium]|nr:hypothetical protein [candidate division Zixibacteria bacterium]
MLLNVILWLALAYLLIVVIWRFLGTKKRGSGQARKAATPGLAQRLFGQGWLIPGLVVVIACIALVVKHPKIIFGPHWNDDEQTQVAHFGEAISLYDQAVEITDASPKSPSDWETVSALLEASLAEAEQVSDPVLLKLHPELKTFYRSRFISGLHAGAFGLKYFTDASKNYDTVAREIRDDSLKVGRTLLGQWNDWFKPSRAEIMKLVE